MIKSKNSIYSFFLIFVVGLVVFFLYPYLKETKVEDIKVNQEKKVLFIYKNCFVIQTDIRNLEESISTKDFENLSFISNIDDLEIANLVKIKKYNFDNLYNFHKDYDISELFLVPIDKIDYRMKVLSIDSIYPLDRNSLKDYPLCIEYSRQVYEDELKNIEKDYVKFQNTFYSFDPNQLLSMFVGGEIIPARAVDRTWLNQSNNYTLLFDRLRKYIEGSDLALAMLENPISGDPTPCRGCMIFVGDEKNAKGFKEVGFDALGVGNHIGDGGENALRRTIQVLSENDIKLAGANTDKNDPSTPVILNFGEEKIAFLSADDVASYYWFVSEWGSNRYSKRLNSGIMIVDKEKVYKDIEVAKNLADKVVVMMSWGNEYTNHSSAHQQELAHTLIDAGADIIVGSHPHWVQEIEIYKNKPIIYSLGNFIFDQTSEGVNAHWSRRNGETRQAMTVIFYFYNGKLINMRFIPHKLCGYEQAGGERNNKKHNLAWRILNQEMSYKEVDNMDEKKGCVWYQPTILHNGNKFYNDVYNRMLEYTNF